MAEDFHKRCPTCEELRVGFTYRELINGLCRKHALEQASGSFIKLTWRDHAGRNRDDYGFLRWYPIRDEVQMVRYVRKVSDTGARVVRERSHNVVGIEPMTEAEYLHMLIESGGHCAVQHFGRTYGGHIIQTARTRVLVRFRGATKTYERWKPAYAVQPNMLSL